MRCTSKMRVGQRMGGGLLTFLSLRLRKGRNKRNIGLHSFWIFSPFYFLDVSPHPHEPVRLSVQFDWMLSFDYLSIVFILSFYCLIIISLLLSHCLLSDFSLSLNCESCSPKFLVSSYFLLSVHVDSFSINLSLEPTFREPKSCGSMSVWLSELT